MTRHPRGQLEVVNGVRSFRGGCTCWPCAIRRIPAKLLDAVFAIGLGVDLLRQRR